MFLIKYVGYKGNLRHASSPETKKDFKKLTRCAVYLLRAAFYLIKKKHITHRSKTGDLIII